MIRSGRSKTDIVDQLQITLQKGQKLRMLLRLQGDEAGMREATRRNRALMREIDRLVGAAMAEWAGSAKSRIEELRRANRRLQTSIRSVQKQQRTAGKVIDALQQLDEVIAQARALI